MNLQDLNVELAEYSAQNSQKIESSFKEKFSHFLTRTDKQYIKESLNFFSDRGIENRLLDNLIDCLPDGAIIAGGFILSVINEDKNASDIDFFFTSEEAFRKTLDLFLNRSEADKKESWAYDGYSLKEGTDLEKSIGNHDVRFITLVHPTRPAIQLIKMVWYESPEHVIDTFDFTVSQVAVDNKGFYFGGGTMLDIARKRIVLHRIQFRNSTLRRLVKYSKKGYYACPGSIANITQKIIDFKGPAEADEVFYVD